MGTVTAIVGGIKFGELILKSIVHYRITTSYSDSQLAAEFAELAGDGVIDTLSENIRNKVNKLFGKEMTMQEKLETIAEIAFNQVNKKYDDKFTGFPAYLEKTNAVIKTNKDMTVHIRRWILEKESVAEITSDDIRNFVNDFYTEVSARVDRDDALKAHLATLRTDDGVKMLMAEIDELKRNISNNNVPQSVDTARIEFAEDVLKQLLDAIGQGGENSITIEGNDSVARDIQQSSGNVSNHISIKGDRNTIERVVQK